ncbi:hypothetical protein BDF22DRAFT_701206 [Syncephalis plumigaleata]|nr:hypothetical protein BDF22DRAFT_701206 [Syncephalis plumigaleata]
MCSFALFTLTAIHTTCPSASILIQPINTISTSYISLYPLHSIEHTLLSTNTTSYYYYHCYSYHSYSVISTMQSTRIYHSSTH